MFYINGINLKYVLLQKVLCFSYKHISWLSIWHFSSTVPLRQKSDHSQREVRPFPIYPSGAVRHTLQHIPFPYRVMDTTAWLQSFLPLKVLDTTWGRLNTLSRTLNEVTSRVLDETKENLFEVRKLLYYEECYMLWRIVYTHLFGYILYICSRLKTTFCVVLMFQHFILFYSPVLHAHI